jgi:hypothetical protein
MDKHTQAVRFEITFPSIRQADREGVYAKLWGVSSDLTAAANRLISLAWMERLKLITPSLTIVRSGHLSRREVAWPIAGP